MDYHYYQSQHDAALFAQSHDPSLVPDQQDDNQANAYGSDYFGMGLAGPNGTRTELAN